MKAASKPSLVFSSLVFYGLMVALAYGLLFYFEKDPLSLFFDSRMNEPPLEALIGALSGLLVVWASRFLGRFPAFKRLNQDFQAQLGRLSTPGIAILAFSSAIGEEFLFRGAAQTLIGFWPTALVFAILHGGGQKKLWAWTLFAFFGALVLGSLSLFTGGLLAPIICHLTINYFNLHELSKD